MQADFDGEMITSDGGGLLLREVEMRSGILPSNAPKERQRVRLPVGTADPPGLLLARNPLTTTDPGKSGAPGAHR